jgi:hypothetical protein
VQNILPTSFSVTVLKALEKSEGFDFSSNFLLPYFSNWLCSSIPVVDKRKLVTVHADVLASVPELVALLTGLRVFSTDLDISLVTQKREGEEEYTIRKLCKCLGIYRVFELQTIDLEGVTVSLEDAKIIFDQTRYYLRRLFVEIQDQLFIFNRSVYEKYLETVSRRPNSVFRLDYCVNGDGNVEFSRFFHLERGFCCGSGCKNCPF